MTPTTIAMLTTETARYEAMLAHRRALIFPDIIEANRAEQLEIAATRAAEEAEKAWHIECANVVLRRWAKTG